VWSRACATPGAPEQRLWGWDGAAWLLALGLAGVCFHMASSLTSLVSSLVALRLRALCLYPCHDALRPILTVACSRVAPDPLCSGDHLLPL